VATRTGTQRLVGVARLYRVAANPLLLVHLAKGQWYLRGVHKPSFSIRVVGKVRVEKHRNACIELGRGCTIRGTLMPSEFVAYEGGRISVGAGTILNYGVSIAAHQSVTIGSYCHIGQLSIISDNDQHEVGNKFQLPSSKPVVIEDGVWLGAAVIVLKGVRIGRDSVVVAGGVVTADVPPRYTVGGVPARIVRSF
jgi:acetyltransferase-like isoleucine patch superfamily enzyme